MKLKLYQVDAFTDRLFGGNPAAVCPLEEWLPKELMQKIASENNLAETAFFVPLNDGFDLKWFTPTVEINLCGHATLASGYILYNFLGYQKPEINFQSNSGPLSLTKSGDWLTLNFPADRLSPVETPQILIDGLETTPKETFRGIENYLTVLSSQEEVEKLRPDFRLLAQLKAFGVIVTAKGKDVDFISRYFAPGSGIDEDPATGSAHTSLAVYWADILKKAEFEASQLSKRGAYLKCKLIGDRVAISGKAVMYLEGEINV